MQIQVVFTNNAPLPINNTEVSSLINIIIPYSMMKITANSPPPYSKLNPLTSSLSLSAWSNGVRFLSAIHIVIQVMNRGMFIINIQ